VKVLELEMDFLSYFGPRHSPSTILVVSDDVMVLKNNEADKMAYWLLPRDMRRALSHQAFCWMI